MPLIFALSYASLNFVKLLEIVSVAKLVNILKFSLVSKELHDYKFFAASNTPDFSAYCFAIYSISDG